MISNPERTWLLSTMGWVDHDALWRYDVATGATETIPFGTGARYASLHDAGGDRFVVAHHFDGRRLELTVRRHADPSAVLSRAWIDGNRDAVEGDEAAWQDVPRLHASFLSFAPWNDCVLLEVLPAGGRIEVRRLKWYDASYDKDYQSVCDVIGFPEVHGALVSVSRSSRLILHDLKTGRTKRKIDLGARGGNPRLKLRDAGREVWASDYDSLVVLRTGDWRIRKRSRLQDSPAGTQQFVGEFAFAPDQPLCVVARPFSGDVIGVDVRTLERRGGANLGREPMEVAVLAGGQIVARDWKTGDLLRGELAQP